MVNGFQEGQALLEKLIVKTVNTSYRISTPAIKELTAPDRRGANPNGIKGWFDRFQNNVAYLDFVDQVMFAAGTGNQAAIVQNYDEVLQWSLNCIPIYSSARYDNWIKVITSGDKAAITKYGQRVARDMKNGFSRLINFQLWGTGTGVICNTFAASNGTTTLEVTLDADRPALNYLTKNQYISIAGATGGTTIAGQPTVTKIISKNTSAQTITVADTLTFAAGAAISAVSPDGSATNAIMGFPGLVVDTGTIQGINLDTLDNQQSHLFNAAGAAFSVSELMELSNACQTGTPNKYFANQTEYNAMIINSGALGNERTGMGKNAYLDIGYKSFTAQQSTVDVILDYDVPYGAVYGLWMDGYTLAILNDVYILPTGGFMRIPGYAVYELAMATELNLGSSNIEANFAYTGLVK